MHRVPFFTADGPPVIPGAGRVVLLAARTVIQPGSNVFVQCTPLEQDKIGA